MPRDWRRGFHNASFSLPTPPVVRRVRIIYFRTPHVSQIPFCLTAKDTSILPVGLPSYFLKFLRAIVVIDFAFVRNEYLLPSFSGAVTVLIIERGIMSMIIFIHQNDREHIKREKNTVITKIALTSKRCRTY